MYHWRYVVLDIGCVAKYGIKTEFEANGDVQRNIDRHLFLFRSFQSKNHVYG
jgi:hypothetical protein